MQTKQNRIRIGQASRDHFISRLDALADLHPIAKSAARHVGENFINQTNFDAIVSRVETMPNWQHLNETGRRDARQKALAGAFVNRARSKLDLKEMRKTLNAALPKLKDREPSDAVGELRDQEIRKMIRDMPQEKRDNYESLPPEFTMAIARAPAALSGLSDSAHQMLRTKIIETEKPAEIAAWRAADEALTIADEALDEVERDAYAAAEFHHEGEYRHYLEANVIPVLAKS